MKTVKEVSELHAMVSDMLKNMNDSQRQIFIDHYGSIEAWKQHMAEGARDEEVQKNYAKVVEWYGSKDAVKEVVKNQPASEVFAAYQKRMGEIQQKLSEKKGTDVNSFEVRKLMGEYDFVAKQLYQMEDPRALLLDLAKGYKENEDLAKATDSVYGDGAAKYIAEAIEAFYS